MGVSIWKIKYEKVVDIFEEEIEPIEDSCRETDIREPELIMDDFDKDFDEKEAKLRSAVRPEVADALKAMAANGDTFSIF